MNDNDCGVLLDSEGRELVVGKIALGSGRLGGAIYPGESFQGTRESWQTVTDFGFLRWKNGKAEPIKNAAWSGGKPPIAVDFEFVRI